MLTLLHVDGPDRMEAFCSLQGLSVLDPEVVERHGPDRSMLVVDGAGRPRARCSLWWISTPPHQGHRLGLVGHYAATDEEAGLHALVSACEGLHARGCTLAVGPMDGSTWRRYRLLTDRGHEPPFLLEPDNPDQWPQHFVRAGFEDLAGYYSVLNSDLKNVDPRISGVEERIARAGITFRTARPGAFLDELRSLFRLSEKSFAENFLYTPIDEAGFIADYAPVEPLVVNELVLIAERAGEPVGFLFVVPDYLQAQRGATIDTVIVKTVAVHPDLKGHGLGSLLFHRGHQAAAALGYRRVIYALMSETNLSRRIAGIYGSTIRRYTLYGRRLAT